MNCNKKKNIFIITTVILGITTVVMSILFGITMAEKKNKEEKLSYIYEKSFYETVDSMNDVELKLSKFSALSGKELRRQLLLDVWRECDLSATNFSQLGTENENMDKVVKFFNQLGDYCYYLSQKLNGAEISAEEEENIEEYHGIVADLNDKLVAEQSNLTDGKTVVFVTAETVAAAIKNHSSVDYPEMIYDGPFSDGLNDREAKFLEDKQDITSDQGIEKVRSYFPTATAIKYIGEGSTNIPTYLYEFSVGRNTGNAQITKKGGFLAMYNAFCRIDDPTLSEEECVEKGDEIISRLGYGEMKAVWVSNDDSTVYINYAYTSNGVIIYPDLVKVKVCSQTGDIIGVEAQNYLYNHVERNVTFPDKTVVINEKLTVIERNECIIPTEWNTEIQAIEVVAERYGMRYYIYLDPSTGEELKVLVVIEESGKLLI